MCTRWYIQGRGRNRFQAGACRGRCGGRRSRDRFFVFSKGLGEYILLTLSNSTSSVAASDPTNYAPFFLLCLPQQNNPTPYSSSSLQFKVQTLLALEVEVKSSEWESSICFHFQFQFHLLRLCGFYHWNRLTDWKAIRKGQLFCFWVGLWVGWTLSWGSIGLKMIL